MGAKPYAAYKDSGVEWIGDIPEHWDKSTFQRLADYHNGYPFKPGDMDQSGKPITRISHLNGKPQTDFFRGMVDQKHHIQFGDLLFSWSATLDSFIWNGPDAFLNQHIYKVVSRLDTCQQYLYYLLKFSAPYLADIEAHGSTMTHIKKSALSKCVFCPPLEEQQLIASFLDRETGKIDTLVEQQQQLISLLKEKRQSLISHTVTKGLNPNVRMKDSGVEWIGEIPEHWEVKPFRTVGAFYGGLSGKAGPDFSDAGANTQYFIPFTNILNNTYINWNELKPVQLDPLEKQNKVRSGDLLFLMSSEDYEFLGWSSVADNVPGNVYLNSFCKGLHVSENVSGAFVNYFNKSIPGRSLIGSVGNGFTRINLRASALAAVRIPFPPLDEQKQIAAFLDRETSKIDQLIDKANQSIGLLKERRSSLISAAVTGKIDVREAA
jgi:type I restriction enzyme S subunit